MTSDARVPRAIALDLFGTLVSPPEVASLSALIPDAAERDPQAMAYATSGFPAALLVAELDFSLQSALIEYLTKPFQNTGAFIAHLCSSTSTASPANPDTVKLVDDLTEYVIENTTLVAGGYELLEKLSNADVVVQLVSDVSEPQSRVFDQLDLGTWFSRPILSWQTGLLKGNGAAFGALEPLQIGNWTVVGDSWRSDVLGAFAAGHDAVFVDRTSQHPARELIRDIAPFLEIAEDTVSIRREFRDAFSRFLPIALDDIEANPGEELRVRPDGSVGLRCLERVTVITEVADLWPLS